jgi:hypothetical protein
MENGSSQVQQIRNELREAQDHYVLAITGGKDQTELTTIRERILALQKQLEDFTSLE